MKKLTILHSNDLHGDFLPEEQNGVMVGGVARLSGYVNKIRAEEENVIYCVAGDMFRGSVIDSEFLGLSTIEIVNMLAPDVVTIGNHETDYGLAHLLFLEKCAKFPIINANLHIKTNQARLFKPYHIMEIDGMKILFIGILTEEVMAQTRNEGVIGSFVDVAEAVEEIGRICNTYRAIDIDLTVLLTHIGYEEDKELASKLNPDWGVDIIIGGHSHTFIEKPEMVNGILLAHAGTGTDQVGRFDLIIDDEINKIADYQWTNVPIDSDLCTYDSDIEMIINYYKDQTDKKYNRLVTHLKRRLTHPSRYCETELGGLFADILRETMNLDVMLLASGSIRNPELGPTVLFSDLCECFPYDDTLFMLKVTGAQFKQMISFMLRDEVWEGSHCEFYQFSAGMRVVYDRTTHTFLDFSFRGLPVEEDKIYTIGLQHYHFSSFEEFFSVPLEEITKNGKPKVIATSTRTVLDEYLSVHQNLDRKVSGRLVILDQT